MSASASSFQYTQEEYLADPNIKIEISQKMKVPDRISFNRNFNGDNQNSSVPDRFNMNVPERILIAGHHQHVGTRAPPREIVFDNSLLPSDLYSSDLPRIATPPRTLTLDKYPFPGVENLDENCEYDQIPVIKTNSNMHLNDTDFLHSNSFKEVLPPIGGGAESLAPAEEIAHLRRQLAKLNRRVVTLELEHLSRLQKEKFIVGFGIAYFLLKVIIWMNRN